MNTGVTAEKCEQRCVALIRASDIDTKTGRGGW
jgi:hypothetical protein